MRFSVPIVLQLAVLTTLAPLVLCADPSVQTPVHPTDQATEPPRQLSDQPPRPERDFKEMPKIDEDGRNQDYRYTPFNPRNKGSPRILINPEAKIPADEHRWWSRVKLPAFMRPKIGPDSMSQGPSTYWRQLQSAQPATSNQRSPWFRFKLPWSSNSKTASTPATQETLSLSRLPSIKGEAPEVTLVPVGPYWDAVRLPGNGWDDAVIQTLKDRREPFYAVKPREGVGAGNRVWIYSPNKEPKLLDSRRAQRILQEMDRNEHGFDPATLTRFRPSPEAAVVQAASQTTTGRGRLWSNIADSVRGAVGKFKSSLISGIDRLRPL